MLISKSWITFLSRGCHKLCLPTCYTTKTLNATRLLNLSCNQTRTVSATAACFVPLKGNLRRLVDGTNSEEYAQLLEEHLLQGSRAALAVAITLVESTNRHKREVGDMLLQALLRNHKHKTRTLGLDGSSFRIGISGAPGVGKSTFIESFGKMLVNKFKKKLAVLTVDPSSHSTGGSILGDMSRMTELSRHPDCYIRQSPTRGALGGVTRGTQEAIIMCEGAGYDLVLVETVGVGQSEIAVAGMVDLYCLLISPTHGDELQGVKRGVMELSDVILVTKADGDLKERAKMTAAEHISALKYLRPRSPHWKPKVLRVSALDGDGMEDIWTTMLNYRAKMIKTGEFEKRRVNQSLQSMWQHVQDGFVATLRATDSESSDPLVPKLESRILQGDVTPGKAADQLIGKLLGNKGTWATRD